MLFLIFGKMLSMKYNRANSLLKLGVAICCSLFSFQTYAQLTVQSGFTAQQLAENLAGENITITNATITGVTNQHGQFSWSGNGFDLNSGIMLSTGDIVDAIGPNTGTGTSTGFGQPGEPLLDSLSGQTTFDAVVLEFDFEVQSDYIEFQYIFASEEYNEWVGSPYNDAFAFFISGPGIVGEENLAVVPSTSDAITINNINNDSYWQYYVDNASGGTNIEFDGYTIEMTAAKGNLIPCNTYHLKLMIADGSDDILDAAVFLKENSLLQRVLSASLNTPTVDGTALEGCIKASFTFNLDSAASEDILVPIEVSGNATNGVDYAFIDSLFIIPAGQTSASIIVDALADGLPEGQEEVVIAYQPQPCAPWDTVILLIDDAQPIEYQTNGFDLGCAGDTSGQVTLNVTGGTFPYSITLTDTTTLESVTYLDTVINDLNAGTYYVDIQDVFGCAGEDIVSGAIYDAGPTFIPDGKGQFYETTLPISGFNGATLQSADQLLNVCAVLEHSFMGELEISLIAPGGQTVILKEQPGGATTNLGEPVAKGPVDAVNPDTSAGVGYEYCWSANATFGLITDPAFNDTYTYTTTAGDVQSDKYMPAGSYTPYETFDNLVGTPLDGDWTIKVQDKIPNDNGWIFRWSISLNADQPDSIITINEPVLPSVDVVTTLPDCGVSNGAINITMVGGNPPFTYSWSNGANSEDLTNVPAGDYILSYTDGTGCTYDTTILLINNGTLASSFVTTDETCVGANDGEIDLTINGGTLPYNISWSNGSNLEDITSLAPGDYVANITDGAGCVGLVNATVNPATNIVIVGNVTDETCGNENGIIDLTVAGGVGNYSYSWSNAETTSRVEFLQAGSYTVTVQDSNNCSSNAMFDVVNLVGNCIPTCDIAIGSETLTNEICGNGSGSIVLTVTGGTQPYEYLWDDGFTQKDRSNLAAGTYSLTITDANDCLFEAVYVINNETGTLGLSSIISDEVCGDGTGAVDVTVTGGALPYLYSWNTGDNTEDLINLNAGDYSISVTDANNCVVNGDYTVANITGSLTQTYESVFDEVCGDSSGSIDITMTGGLGALTYSWSNGEVTEDLRDITSGDYFCVITDGSGCSYTTPTYTVNNQSNDMLIFDIDIFDETCSNGLGRLNVDVINGTLPYSYLWSNADTNQVADTLSEGTYSCIITDSNGCSVETGDLIVLNTSGTLNLDNMVVTDEICGNGTGSVDLTISGEAVPYTFLWSNGASTEDLTNLTAGTYTATVTDTNGCQLNINAVVGNNQGTLALLNQVITDEVCGDSNGAVNLTISGGTLPYLFNWDNGANTEDLMNLKAGTFNAIITDAFGCEITTQAVVNNQTGDLSLDNTVITNEVCGNTSGAIDITISGGTLPYTFAWSNGANSEDLTGLVAGTYSCVITDGLGCTINVGPITINNSSPGFTITLDSTVEEICGNGAGAIYVTTAGGTLPYTFAWSSGSNSEDLINVGAGNYTLTVTDGNGCSTQANFDVINNAGTFNLVSSIITNEICGDGSGAIDITTVGGNTPISYNWTGATGNSEDQTGLSAGIYSVEITDQNGCVLNSGNLNVINDPGTLSLDNVQTINEQCADGTGSVNLTVSGGTAPIDFAWSNSDVTEDITGLSAGIYTCVISDQNGCTVNANAVVQNDPGTLVIVDEVITSETCDQMNGGVDLTVAGGIAPYTFAWSNGGNGEDLINVSGGNYNLLITDNIGCQLTYNTTVPTAPNDLAIVGATVIDETCGNVGGAVYLNVNGSQTPIMYNWSDGGAVEDNIGLSAGQYFVDITDNAGCAISDTFVLDNDTSNCNFVMCGYTGSSFASDTIQDSGADGIYGPNENCGFLINPFCADSITLTFLEMDIDAFGDFLAVYDGTSNADPLIGFYNGTFIPGPAVATSGSMYLEFNSDGGVEGQGFTAVWNTTFINDIVTANFTADNFNPAFNAPVAFTDLSTGNPTEWEWDFGDGNTSIIQNPVYNFTGTGSYNVTLIASSCFMSDTIVQTVNVQGPGVISVNPTAVNVNLLCGDSTTAPITITNIGTGDLVVDVPALATVTEDQTQSITFSGVDNVFSYALSPSLTTVNLTVTINGDYDATTEFADLIIEGTFIETIVDGDVSNGTDIVSSYTFSGVQLATWLADGQLDVTVANSAAVDPGIGGGLDLNTVEVDYQASGWISDPSVQSTILPGDSITILLDINSSSINGGVFNESIVINSSDTGNAQVIVPVILTVTGTPTYAYGGGCIDYGVVYQGVSVLDSALIYNTGCDTLFLTSITTDNGDFTSTVSSMSVAPYDSAYLYVTLLGNTLGATAGNLNLVTNDGNYSICLNATIQSPPMIEVTPNPLSVMLDCGDSTTSSLVVKNNGGSDLIFSPYVMGGDLVSDTIQQSITFTGQTTNFAFSVPSYLQTLDIEVTINGDYDGGTESASLVIEGTLIETMPDGNPFNGTDIVNTYTFSGAQLANWIADGTLNVAVQNSGDVNPGIGGLDLNTVSLTYMQNDWLIISNATDTIPSGDSIIVPIDINASTLVNGVYLDSIAVVSNDPINGMEVVQVDLTVNGTATLSVSDSCLNFGNHLVGTSVNDTLIIDNFGCDTLYVTSIISNVAEFVPQFASVNIAPFSSVELPVTFNANALATYNGQLTILSSDIDTTICLSGSGSIPPAINVVPNAISTTLNCGDIHEDTLVVYNTGGVDLITQSINNVFVDSIETQNVQYFATDASTIFNFNIPSNVNEVSVQVTVNGDFDGGTEFADVYVEGTFIETILDGNPTNGTNITANYVFNGAQLAAWLADGVLSITVDNSPAVNPNIGGLDQKTVSVQYATGSWLLFTESTDTIVGGDSLLIPITIDPFGLTPGVYQDSITFLTNIDGVDSVVQVPIDFTLVGSVAMELSDSCLTFPITVAGDSITDTLTISNTGCDTLYVTNINSDNAVFWSELGSITVPPFSNVMVPIGFSPNTTGMHNGNLIINSNDYDTTVCLSGEGAPAPVIVVVPDTIDVVLDCNDSTQVPVQVYNTGGVDLIYTPTDLTFYDSTATNFFFVTDATTAFSFDGIDPNLTEIEMTVTINGDYDGGTETADIIIEGTFIQTITTSPTNGIDIVVNLTLSGAQLAGWIADGTLDVLIDNSPAVNPNIGAGQDFHTVQLTTGGDNSWYDYSMVTNTIAPGDSALLLVDLNSTGLIAGNYTTTIGFVSNDPVNSVLEVPVNMVVNGLPTMDFSAPCILYADTYLGLMITDSVGIINNGCDTLFINNITSNNGDFVPQTTVVTLAPGESTNVLVDFTPSSVGTITGDLTFSSNIGNQNVCLSGTSLLPPEIDLTPTPLNVNVTCGSTVQVPVTVKNVGGGELIFNAISEDTVSIIDTNLFFITDATTAFSFTGLDPNLPSMDLTITINGDFDGGTESADLYIEGAYFAPLPDGGVTNGIDIVNTFNLSGAQLTTWLADGTLDLEVNNTAAVNPNIGAGLDYHIAEISYANSTWMSHSTAQDTVVAGDSTQLLVTIDASSLIAGVHNGNIEFLSNDLTDPSMILPVNVTVTGGPEIDVSDSCIVFPDVYIGSSLNDTLTILNNGCDTLYVTNIVSNEIQIQPQFTTATIAPFSQVQLPLTLNGLIVGAINGNLSISSNDVNMDVCLQGNVVLPPVIEVTPDTLHAILNCNDSSEVDLVIKNIGGADLITSTALTTPFNSIIDTVEFTLTSQNVLFAFNIDPSTDTVNLTVTVNGDYDGTTEFASVFIEGTDMGDIGVGTQPYNSDLSQSYVLFGPQLATWLADGVLNVTVDNSAAVNAIGNDLNIVEIGYPEANWLTQYSVVSQTVPAGDSLAVPVMMNSTGLPAGIYNATIAVSSNDPANGIISVPVVMEIVDAPQLGVPTACVDFGTVNYSGTGNGFATITNDGCGDLTVANLSVDNAEVTVVTPTPFVIPVGGNAVVQLAYTPITNGTLTGNLLVTSNGGDSTICITGVGAGVPSIASNGDTIFMSLDSCSSTTISDLILYNEGQANLIYNLGAPPVAWLAYTASSGTIVAGDSVVTTMTADGSGLADGIYYANILVTTNDPANATLAVVVSFEVGNKPLVAVSNTCVDFGNTYVGYSDTLYYPVHNYGCDILTVTNVTSDNGDYTPLQTTATILVGDTAWLPVVFDPSVAGPINGTLTVFNNDKDTTVCLTGVGVLAPEIQFNYDTIVNVNCSDIVQNTLNIGNIGLAGLNYTITEGMSWLSISPTSGTVAPSGSTDVTLTFDGTGLIPGSYSGWFTITSDDPSDPVLNLPLVLVYTETSDASVSDSCIDLGIVAFGNTASGSTMLYNTGCTVLDVTNITSDNPNINVTTSTNFSLMPGDSSLVTVSYMPDSNGILNGNILIENNGMDQLVCVTAVGTGVPGVTLSNDTVVAGVDSCNNITTSSLTLSNTGEGTMTYTPLASNYSWLSFATASGNVTAGNNAVLPLNFDATGLTQGTYYGEINLLTNDPLNDTITATVQFNVDRIAEVIVQTECVVFDTVPLGNTGNSQMWISNAGCDTLFVNNITSSDVTVSATQTNFFILPGDTAFVPVTFTPSVTGAVNGQFTINNSDMTTTICFEGYAILGAQFGANTDTLNFAVDNCVNELDSDTIVMSNSGAVDLTYSVDQTALSSWVTVSPLMGTIGGSMSENLVVDVDGTGLPTGLYIDTIMILTNDISQPMVSIPVYFDVVNEVCGDFDYVTQFCNGTVTFTDLSGNSPDSWNWDFGDGNTSTQQNPVHTYLTSGTFNVTLIACNGSACDTIIKSVTVSFVDAAFTMSADTVNIGEDLVLLDASTGATSWFWDFGNGSTTNVRNAITSYGASGDYKIFLEVSNGSCNDFADGVVYVRPKQTGILDDRLVDLSIAPNPYRGKTKIQLTLANMAHVKMKVYNTLGEEVATLCDEKLPSNTHQFEFSAMEIGAAQGMYYLQVDIDGKVSNYKLIEKR